jgi:transposase InsO family protein
MDSLDVTIQDQPFEHMIYHFVMTYSNWEAGTVCFSESFESLSEGLQNALHQLGGVPRVHQTDSLSAAVKKIGSAEEFTDRYQALLAHYGLKGQHTQPRKPHENGDIEQRHHRFKEALDQRLMLRGSRDFEDREAYEKFLRNLFAELNAGRQQRLNEELALLRELPLRRLENHQRVHPRVSASSTICVKKNIYSVHSRLINEKVEARVFAEQIEVWYASQRVEVLPRLRGEGKHCINYRHIIDWLVRKPGAFGRYRYRDALYPTSRFRIAYRWMSACAG